jgi:hypothetical protein
MSRTDEPLTDDRTDSTTSTPTELDEAKRRIDELEAENRRLREDYVRTKQRQNRMTAGALLVIGLIGLTAGIAFPDDRTVLFALGATGVFGAILTYFLSPERVLPAAVGRSMYDAVSDTGSAVRDELGLTTISVYCPVQSAADRGRAPVRLFVPQSTDYELPSEGDLRSTFVVPEDGHSRGVAFTPSATGMLEEFEQTASGSMSDQPETLANQLCDSLVEQFELARSAEAESDRESRRVTVRVSGSAYPSVTGFDHPIPSLLGGGFAWGLEEPVTVETVSAEDESAYLVTCRW